MDKFDTKLPFGKYAGKTIRELYKEYPAVFLATIKVTPKEEEKKKLVLLMKEYLEFVKRGEKSEQIADGFDNEPDFGTSSITSETSHFDEEPDFGGEPDFDSDSEGFSRINVQESSYEPYTNYDSKRYINQIWAYKTSNKDKTVFKTLAVDSKIKMKKMDSLTVSPLDLIDDVARFHIVLITKTQKETIIRKMGLNPKHLRMLNSMYNSICSTELNLSLGVPGYAANKKYTLLNEKYMYMSDGKGRRNYESVINYTSGNNYPFYLQITNILENNGVKTSLGSEHILLNLDDFGSMLESMTNFLNDFRNEKFHQALGCALEGGYLDEMFRRD